MEITSKAYIQQWNILGRAERRLYSSFKNIDYIRSLSESEKQQKFNQLSEHRHLIHAAGATYSSVSFVVTILMKNNERCYPDFSSVLLQYCTYSGVISHDMIESIKKYYTKITTEYSISFISGINSRICSIKSDSIASADSLVSCRSSTKSEPKLGFANTSPLLVNKIISHF